MSAGKAHRWVILTGEFPPIGGGVGDYTAALLAALGKAGDEALVFVLNEELRQENGQRADSKVEFLGTGLRGLWQLDRRLRSFPSGQTLLVQYVPQAFGWKGLNVPFCLFLFLRRSHWDIWVMFHEVAYRPEKGEAFRFFVLGAVTHWMARCLAAASSKILVSIPAWAKILREVMGVIESIVWLPVPSNLPIEVGQSELRDARDRLNQATTALVGHFGTYGAGVCLLLEPIVLELLARHAGVSVLLIGRGSDRFLRDLVERHGREITRRVYCTGQLPPAHAANQIAMCDLLVQPYPDGISTRRTSAMAGLALGRPIISNLGRLTEDLWGSCGAICLVSAADQIASHALDLLSDQEKLLRIGKAAHAFYREHFSFEVVAALLQSLRSSNLFVASAREV